MRIGIDARMLGSAPGIGRYTDFLLRELFRLDHENEYVLFLREPVFRSYDVPEARVRKVLAPERWYSIREQITLPFRILRERLDLLFVPQFNVPLFVPCPFVVTIHDVTQLYVPGPLQRRHVFRRQAFRRVFGHAVRQARAVIAVSNYTKKEIRENFSVHGEKIHVIYEGPGFLEASAEAPAQPPIEGPYLLAVGDLRPHKNFVGLIDAFAVLRTRDPRWSSLKLVLIGQEDPRYPEVRERLASGDFGASVLTPGMLKDEDLDRWYRCARAVVVPSFFEGFGFVGLEALARGVPVVAARRAAIPEVLGEAATYFDPDDIESMTTAIARALSNEQERRRVLIAAPATLARYSWERMAKETLEVFRTVLRNDQVSRR